MTRVDAAADFVIRSGGDNGDGARGGVGSGARGSGGVVHPANKPGEIGVKPKRP